MDLSHKQWIALAFATIFVSVSGGFAFTPTDFHHQLDSLRQDLLEAKAANRAVRHELDGALEQYFNEDELTEARAVAIANLVEQVLLDSDTRMSLQGGRPMIGWNNGFYMASADSRFSLNIGGLSQSRFFARWEGVDPNNSANIYDQWLYSFGQHRTELNFSGHVFNKGLEYYLSTGWGRYDPNNLTADTQFMTWRLWEAWLKFKFNQGLSVKLGTFELPFTRESLIQSPYQLAVDKSVLDYRLGLSTTTGVQWTWASDESRFKLALSNGSGAMFHFALWSAQDPTPPLAAMQKDTSYSVTMRHEWKLLGGWEQFNQFTSPPGSERGILLGIAGHRQNTERDSALPLNELPDGNWWAVTGDLSMQFDGASLFAAVIYERIKDFAPNALKQNWLAFVLQGGTYITNQTELFARYETGSSDVPSFGDPELQIITAGLNHYIDGQDLKFTADIGFSLGEVSLVMSNSQTGWYHDRRQNDQVVLRTQLQFMF